MCTSAESYYINSFGAVSFSEFLSQLPCKIQLRYSCSPFRELPELHVENLSLEVVHKAAELREFQLAWSHYDN